MEFIRLFNHFLHRYPKSMEMLTAFGLTFNSDITCQFIDYTKKDNSFIESFDFKRAFNLASFRAIAVPPVIHYWYKFVNFHYPCRSLEVVFIKSVFDRLTIGTVLIFAFYASQTYLNGGDYNDFVNRMEMNFVETAKMNVFFWTGFMMINYRYVPHHFQALFFNTIAFFWMIYLSHVLNKKIK